MLYVCSVQRYWPRRPLFLVCGVLAGLGLFSLGFVSYARRALLPTSDHQGLVANNNIIGTSFNSTDEGETDWPSHVLSWSPVACLVLTYVSYSLGVDSVVRVLLGEVFPTEIRAMASGICIVASMSAMNVTSFLLPRLFVWIGFHVTFW